MVDAFISCGSGTSFVEVTGYNLLQFFLWLLVENMGVESLYPKFLYSLPL